MTKRFFVTYPPSVQDAIKRTLTWQKEINKIELSDREFQFLEMMSLGWDNQRISKVLKISPNTCRAHIRSILMKLEAENRVAAISKAFRCGLLSC